MINDVDVKEKTVRVAWACPKCGASVDKCGRGECGERSLTGGHEHDCAGFLCECEEETHGNALHGETQAHPCHNAKCYHCGWCGRFPRPPRNMKPWEKTALAAGWTPPAGWEAGLKQSGRVAGEE